MVSDTLRVHIVNTALEHCEALVALEEVVFPTLRPVEWFTLDMYRAHVATFPEGQLTALVDGRVVGGTTTFRTSRSFNGDVPYYFDVIGRGYLTTHDPHGEWLYGVDMKVHPDYRRLGIGTRLYEARQALVRRLNLRGEIVAGMLPGYARYQPTMTVDAYVSAVVAGDLTDPTLTMQLRNGFRVRRLLHGYIHDSCADDTCTLLVRENPNYDPTH